MDLSSVKLREDLAARDEGFRQLHEEHQACERRLTELQRKFGLTVEEELEEKRLKKQKLHLRDQMEAWARSNAEPAPIS
jgi:uncharacterized protein YdcH (DUF465 family)